MADIQPIVSKSRAALILLNSGRSACSGSSYALSFTYHHRKKSHGMRSENHELHTKTALIFSTVSLSHSDIQDCSLYRCFYSTNVIRWRINSKLLLSESSLFRYYRTALHKLQHKNRLMHGSRHFVNVTWCNKDEEQTLWAEYPKFTQLFFHYIQETYIHFHL